jgi:hypothetical protein
MALPFKPTGFHLTSNLIANRLAKYFPADQEKEMFEFAREMSSPTYPLISIEAWSAEPKTFAVCHIGSPHAPFEFMKKSTDWRTWVNDRFVGGFPLDH